MGVLAAPEPLIVGLRGVFNPDIFLVHPSYDLMVAGVAVSVPKDRRNEVRAFLDDALSGGRSNGELRELWRKAGAEAYIRTSAWCRLFLEDVRLSLADGKALQ